MSKYKIGYNEQEEELYNDSLKTKQNVGRNALEYASQFIVLSNVNDFYSNMVETFAKLFKEQYNEVFDKRILTEYQYKQVGFHIEKLRSYQTAFNSIDIPLNDKLEPFLTKDFNIYLTDEKEITVYKNKEKFLKALNEYISTGADIKEAIFQRALPMQFNFDYSTGQLRPN